MTSLLGGTYHSCKELLLLKFVVLIDFTDALDQNNKNGSLLIFI